MSMRTFKPKHFNCNCNKKRTPRVKDVLLSFWLWSKIGSPLLTG